MARTKTPKVQGATRGKRPQPGGGPGAPTDTGRNTGGAPRWVPVALAVALAVVLILVLSGVIGGSDPLEERSNELREQALIRDREQIEELTEMTFEIRDEVVFALSEFNAYVPDDDDVTVESVDASAEEIQSWQETMASATEAFDESPSGATGTNMARNSLGLAVHLLESTMDTYALAAQADGQLEADLIAQAVAHRDLALRAWSTGATQLDGINVEAGFGHRRIYLDVDETVSPDAVPEDLAPNADDEAN